MSESPAAPTVPADNPTWAGASRTRLGRVLRTTVGPLLLMVVTPPAIIVLWIAATYLDGSLSRLPTAAGLRALRDHFPAPSPAALAMVLGFAAFQWLLLVALPGRIHEGPITPAGDRPRYRRNGVSAYLVTHAAFLAGGYPLGLFSPAVIYDRFGELLITLSLLALLFCLLLYFKGVYFPSSRDAGRSGNFIFDYYWGVELHPRLFGVELKQLVNCRVSMTGWTIIVVSFAARQHADGHLASSMVVCAALQWLYIFKFFVWETGYFGSLDIMHDRFGYYICWGVLAWVPGVYTSAAQYLVKHPIDLPLPVAALLFLLGAAAIWVNYDADAQRQRTRESHGTLPIWGRTPELIHAEYTTADGVRHESLLLASGWWGVARHFHYLPEVAIALAWTLPALFHDVLPYFYVIFLSILLLDRASRDDLRCRRKYGEHWARYCEKVPWKIVPWVY